MSLQSGTTEARLRSLLEKKKKRKENKKKREKKEKKKMSKDGTPHSWCCNDELELLVQAVEL